jgi:hypothetical protein
MGCFMDKFEEMMQKMQKMSDAEKKTMLDGVKPKCVCMKCPTYNDCMKGKHEVLFCATGKTGCSPTKKACICPTCPVTPMMGLKNMYYCISGSEQEQRKK